MKHDEFCEIIGCGQFVRDNSRRRQPRPQPPMKDRRTKRERTRGTQQRRAIEEGR